MGDGWRHVRLRQVMHLELAPVAVGVDSTFDLAGVYSFGRGLFERGELAGHSTSYRYLHRLRAGQLVMSKLKAWEGALTVVTEPHDGRVLSPEFPTYTLDQDVFLPAFAHLLTQWPPFWKAVAIQSRGMGGRKERVHPERLLDVEINLPPASDQRRIVELMAAADKARAVAQRYAETASRAYVVVANEQLRSGTPRALGEVVDVTIGRQRSPLKALGQHIVPYLRAANVKDGVLALDDVLSMNFDPHEQARFSLQPGDVLVTEGCGSLSQLGASAVWERNLPGVVCFQNTLLRLRAKPGVSTPGFVHHLARHAHHSGLWASIASGTNIFHIGSRRAESLIVPIPEVKDQVLTAAILDDLDQVRFSAVRVALRIVRLRQALLSALLSGEHEIPGSYDRFLDTVA